jgi:hypothetical protein
VGTRGDYNAKIAGSNPATPGSPCRSTAGAAMIP